MALRDARRDLKLAQLEGCLESTQERLDQVQGVNAQLRDEASRLRLERDQAHAALRAPLPVDPARESDRQKAYNFESLVGALAELSLKPPTALSVGIATLPGAPLPVNKIVCVKAMRQLTGLALGPSKTLAEALFDAQARGAALAWRFYAQTREDARVFQDAFHPFFQVDIGSTHGCPAPAPGAVIG